jgi:hypothetical protein
VPKQNLGAAQGAADALDLELAGGELAGGLGELAGAVEGVLVAVSMRRKVGAALRLGCAELQPRQTSPRAQCSPAGSAHRCEPMSRNSTLWENSRHSAASGARRLSGPWKSA